MYFNRVVKKLILHQFLFYGNTQLKQFCDSSLQNKDIYFDSNLRFEAEFWTPGYIVFE